MWKIMNHIWSWHLTLQKSHYGFAQACAGFFEDWATYLPCRLWWILRWQSPLASLRRFPDVAFCLGIYLVWGPTTENIDRAASQKKAPQREPVQWMGTASVLQTILVYNLGSGWTLNSKNISRGLERESQRDELEICVWASFDPQASAKLHRQTNSKHLMRQWLVISPPTEKKTTTTNTTTHNSKFGLGHI